MTPAVTILLIDDEPGLAELLAARLTHAGFAVALAGDGMAGLRRLEDHPGVSLIIMDAMMPGMDGYETTRQIRADARWKTLPILFLTARAQTSDREAALGAGANDYLLKPFDAAELLAKIRALLSPT